MDITDNLPVPVDVETELDRLAQRYRAANGMGMNVPNTGTVCAASFWPMTTASLGAMRWITVCIALPVRVTRAARKPRSAPSSPDRGPAAENTCTQSN